MRLVCAWCQKDISMENSSGEISQDISYGICPTCRARFFPGSTDSPPPPEREKGGMN
jgi:hypothetical protein